MGQRTFIICKKNYKDGHSDIDVIHYQWGFAKTMPAVFMEEIIKNIYGDYSKTFADDFLFDKKNSYNLELDSNTDIFDCKTIKNIAYTETDNNNGCMCVEVTEGEYAHGFKSAKIAFMFGDEDKQSLAFTELVSPKEYMKVTGGARLCPASFIKCFENFCKTFDIEIITTKKIEE